MRKVVRTLIVAMGLAMNLLLLTPPALAEPTLQEILDSLGYSYINVATDETGLQTFPVTPGVTYSAQVLARYAGSLNRFGWYIANLPGSRAQIFSGGDGPGTSLTFTIPTDVTSIGYYIYHEASGNHWYTESTFNGDSKDHAFVFETQTAGEYIIAWEDLPNLGDADFQDVVILAITPVSAGQIAPVVSVSFPDSGASRTAIWSAVDDDLHDNPYRYILDIGSWSDWTTATSHTFTGLDPEGIYTITVEARDKAGNVGSMSISGGEIDCSDTDRLTRLYVGYALLADGGREAGFILAADLLDHFLGNSGEYYPIDPSYYKTDSYVIASQMGLYTVAKERIKGKADTIERCGETKEFNFSLASHLIVPILSVRLYYAVGRFYLKSTHRGTIEKKHGEGGTYYDIDMETTWRIDDDYNWHVELRGYDFIPDAWAKELVTCGWAAEFPMGASWIEPERFQLPTDIPCEPPAVTLAYFTATGYDGDVLVEWETASELDNAGFNVWRSEAGKEQYVKLNERLIPGQGDTYKDTSYSDTDTTVTAGVTYYYKLEDVDLNGVGTFHGPVSVVLKPRFTLNLDAGINLISVPLNHGETWTLSDLADVIGRDNLDVIIYLKNGKFIVYETDFADGLSANVPIASDEAYIVVMKSPAEVTFTGKAWDGEVSLSKGLDMMAVPVNPGPLRLSDLASYIGNKFSSIIWYDRAVGRFVAYNSAAPEVGDTMICGGGGYIVSMTAPADLNFEGEAWTNTPDAVTSTPALVAHNRTATPLLIIEGTVLRKDTGQKLNDIKVTVRNLNTGSIVTSDTDSIASSGRYRAILADLIGNRAAQVGDVLEVTARDSTGALEAKQMKHIVTEKDVQAGKISLGTLSLSPIPKRSVLLANYPNPFNPETWIPYKLSEAADVMVRIYNANGQLVRNLILGRKAAGTYIDREKAAYWDGKNEHGEKVASGVYFYSIKAGRYTATRKMLLRK